MLAKSHELMMNETLKKRGFNEALKLSSTIFTMRQKEEEE